MITAIAIDDEPWALHVIRSHCKKIDFIDLQKEFTDPLEALKYLKKYPVELLFLDIQMPAISGIDFYKVVPQKTAVIFTTAHSQYAVEGFELAALDFLLKPVEFERFQQAAERAREYVHTFRAKDSSAVQYLYVRADHSLVKLTIADILYVEGQDNYLKIHLQNSRAIVARMSMKAMAEKLAVHHFIRVHRSFIVPVSEIERVRPKSIFLKSGQEFPIGAAFASDIDSVFRD